MPRQLVLGTGALFNEDLHESAGFRFFPRQGLFASCELYDHVADPPRFAAFQHDILRQVVPLIEETQRRYPVFHRGTEFALHHLTRLHRVGSARLHFGWRGRSLILAPRKQQTAQRERRNERRKPGKRAHQASGVQA